MVMSSWKMVILSCKMVTSSLNIVIFQVFFSRTHMKIEESKKVDEELRMVTKCQTSFFFRWNNFGFSTNIWEQSWTDVQASEFDSSNVFFFFWKWNYNGFLKFDQIKIQIVMEDMVVSINGDIPLAGWFMCWKIPPKNGWELGVTPFQETSIYTIYTLWWTNIAMENHHF